MLCVQPFHCLPCCHLWVIFIRLIPPTLFYAFFQVSSYFYNPSFLSCRGICNPTSAALLSPWELGTTPCREGWCCLGQGEQGIPCPVPLSPLPCPLAPGAVPRRGQICRMAVVERTQSSFPLFPGLGWLCPRPYSCLEDSPMCPLLLGSCF